MEILRYNESRKQDWDDSLEKSKNGLFIFNRNYMEYHRERFIDHSLIVYKKNKIIAIFPANEDGKEIIGHGGLTFGYLIMSYDMKAVEVLETMKFINEYYINLGFLKIIYKSSPSIFHKYPSDEDLYALNICGAKIFRRDLSSVIKVKDGIRFSESKRQAITKCIKNNIEVTENNNFSDYWELLTEVLSKFGVSPVHNLEEIHLLKSHFPNNIRLFEAKKDETLLAGLLIFDYGNTIHTQYMANSQIGRKFGALDYINHTLITQVFADREYYSFGISTEDQGLSLNEGLIQQKEMMGGRGIAIDFYSIELNKIS